WVREAASPRRWSRAWSTPAPAARREGAATPVARRRLVQRRCWPARKWQRWRPVLGSAGLVGSAPRLPPAQAPHGPPPGRWWPPSHRGHWVGSGVPDRPSTPRAPRSSWDPTAGRRETAGGGPRQRRRGRPGRTRPGGGVDPVSLRAAPAGSGVARVVRTESYATAARSDPAPRALRP